MLNPALVSNYLSIKEKGLLIAEQPEDTFQKMTCCTAYGNRTRESSVKGMRLNPLTNAAETVKPNRLLPFRGCKDID